MKVLCGALCFLALVGCSPADEPEAADTTPTRQDIAFADSALPADVSIAAIYDRSCRSCHSIDGMGAPLTGHKAAWDVRFGERGITGLLASTKKGYNAMPAMGLCNDCSDEELTALTLFMAGRS